MNHFRKMLIIVLLWQLILSSGVLNGQAQQHILQTPRQNRQQQVPANAQPDDKSPDNQSDNQPNDETTDQPDTRSQDQPVDQIDQRADQRVEQRAEPLDDPPAETSRSGRRRVIGTDDSARSMRRTDPEPATPPQNLPDNSSDTTPNNTLVSTSDGKPQTSPGSSPTQPDLADGETLKIGVELVQVVFSVIDDHNRLVTDLKPTEFKLLDNGQPQELELFRRSNNLPMMLSILIDISGSQEFLLPDEKTAVNTFFDSFFREGRDYGAILTFQGETSLGIGLTSNLSRLKTALQHIKREETFRDEEAGVPNLGTALFDAIDITSREVLDGKTARRITNQDANKTENRRTAIRRAICVLTDGVDTASQLNLQQAIRSAQRLGIAVYALGVGDRFRYGNVNQQTLDQLCRDTGGRAFYPKSDTELRQAFQQVSTELSSQYILAYYPTSGESTNNFREIEIKIPGQPGWHVIHRRGYVSDK